MFENKIIQKIKNKESITNAWLSIPNAWTAEILAHSGFDVLTIDAQHGLSADLATILPMLQATHGEAATPFVRVPDLNPSFIMSMLDAGVQGIICPMLNTKADFEKFVAACRYPPNGFRSFGPTRATTIYGSDYFKQSDEHIIKLGMIETKEAYENIEEIAKTEGLTGFYIGPWDLSLALSLPKLADFEDSNFLKIIENIVNHAKKNNLITGMHCGTPEIAKQMQDMGITFLTFYSDTKGIQSSAKFAYETFHAKKSLSNTNPY